MGAKLSDFRMPLADRGPALIGLRRFALLAVFVFFYCAVLYWVYVNRVLRFEYLGYTYEEPHLGYLIVSAVALALLAFMLPQRIERPSTFVLWLLFALVIVPGAQISLYSGYVSPEKGLLAALVLISGLGIVRLITMRKRVPALLAFVLPSRIFWIAVAVFSAGVYVVIGVAMGSELRLVGLSGVYELRDSYKAALASSGSILGYLVGTQANVVNPLLVIRGITSRNYGIAALGLLGQVLIFSATGFRTVLFSVPAIIAVSIIFLLRSRPRMSGFSDRPITFGFGGRPRASIFVWAPALVMVVSVLVDLATNSIVWTSLFGRRFIVTPGLMTGIYAEYYSENPPALLAHSVLPWLDTPYEFAPARTIGFWVTGSSDVSMNAHLFADGFANFGLAGVIGAAAVLGIYLRMTDRASVGLPPAVPSLLLLMLTITLSNTSILTAMFSHGLVAAFLVLVFAPRDGWEPVPGRRSVRQFIAEAGKRSKRPSAADA